MMRTIFLIITITLVAVGGAFGQQEPADSAQAELAALRAELAALRAELVAAQQGRQVVSTQPPFTVAVMEVRDSRRIPEVRDGFRVIIVSALREAGILAVESLDRETQRMVQQQREAVVRGYVNPATIPMQGSMTGARYFLAGTVVKYREEDSRDDLGGAILAGLIGGRVKTRVGSLVVDFRLIDAQSGVAVDSFRTEASVREREVDGLRVGGIAIGGRTRERAMPEIAARECARQAAERIRFFISAPSGATVETTEMRLTPPHQSQ